MKKIIVAGAGHGGLACAALLAKNGFEVAVYEKNTRKKMGYDWTDIFAPKALGIADIRMPDVDKFEYKTDMTFYGPSENKGIRQRVPFDELEIKMERKEIYNLLISNAEDAGVKIHYSHTILGPICIGDRVVGIKTNKGDFYADLVIDACGCESPVRANLPDCCGIQKHPALYEKFYIYRAFYNRATKDEVIDKYKVYLLPEGKLGIGWVATEDEYTDLLIGRFEEFDMDEVERSAAYMRLKNPSLGTKKVRGGQFVQIPVRQPLSILDADGFAAIGDSAFMTVPIIGSGIANSLKAAPMLANAVINDSSNTYCAEALWSYQRDYYKDLGNGLAPLAQVKLLLTRITPQQLDYIIDNEILTWREMTITAETTSLWKMIHPASDMPARGLSIVHDADLTKKLLEVVKLIGETVAVCEAMPRYYGRHAVTNWAQKYDKLFNTNK